MAGSGSVNCNGYITATITWSDPDNPSNPTPPPSAIIVEEDVSASWSGATGAVSNGLSSSFSCGIGSQSAIDDSTYTTATYGADNATQYTEIDNPPVSFTILIHPTASASLWPGFVAPSDCLTPLAASANVNYQAIVHSISINLSGTYSIANPTVVASRQINATLSLDNGFTCDDYNWATVAASAFESYDPYAAQDQYTPLGIDPTTGDSDFTQPTFSFFTNDTEKADVSCQAQIVCPDGVSVLTADVSTPLQAVQPIYVSGTPDAKLVDSQTVLVGNQPINEYGADIYLRDIVVNVPAPYVQQGSLSIVQLIQNYSAVQTGSIQYPTTTLPTQLTAQVVDPSTGQASPIPSNFLDTTFPYLGFGYTSTPGAVVTQAPGGIAQLPNYVDYHDRPMTIEVSNSNSPIQWNKSVTNMTTDAYLMYQYASSSVWVPIAKLHWGFNATTSYNSSTHGWSLSTPVTSDNSNPSLTVSHVSGSNFPEWSVTVNFNNVFMQ